MRISNSRSLLFLVLLIFLCCESKDVKPTVALVKIYVSSIPLDTSVATIGVRFNFAQAIFSKTDFMDSVYTEETYLSYLELGSGVSNYKIDSASIPYGNYNSLSFYRWAPSGLSRQLFKITGYFRKTAFVFWNGVRFTISFPNKLNLVAGEPVNLLLKVDLNRALNPQLGGVDISKAVDGNNDGYIEIEPTNIDGNAALADSIFLSIVKNISIQKL